MNEIYLVALKAMPPYFLHSTSVQTQVNNERRRLEELVRLLEEVVEILGPIRRGSLEGETGHSSETALALLRGTLNNCV